MKHTLLLLCALIMVAIQSPAQNNKFFAQYSRSWNFTEQVQNKYLLLGNQQYSSGLIIAFIGTQHTGLYLYRIIDLQGKLVDSGKLIIR